jgi:hypothetical protein
LSGGGEEGVSSLLAGVFFCSSSIGGSKVLRKFNNPKGSKIKNPPKSLKLTEKP